MSKSLFTIARLETGKLNALVKNLMTRMNIDDPVEAVRRVNSGEWVVVKPAHRWREQNGAIYFKVTSNGMTGPKWIEHFNKKGIQISKWVQDILLSPDFKATCGVTTEVAVLMGILFTDNDRITDNIRAEAGKRNLTTPEAELGCLIRDMFTEEEIEAMGLEWIVAFHEPIKDSVGNPSLLGTGRNVKDPWLCSNYDEPGNRWFQKLGFAFVVSQVSSS